MAALPLEPCSEAAVLIMMFEEQDGMAVLCELIRPGQSGQPAADYDHVVIFRDTFKPISCFCHVTDGLRAACPIQAILLKDRGC